jgi:hypothetical protein
MWAFSDMGKCDVYDKWYRLHNVRAPRDTNPHCKSYAESNGTISLVSNREFQWFRQVYVEWVRAPIRSGDRAATHVAEGWRPSYPDTPRAPNPRPLSTLSLPPPPPVWQRATRDDACLSLLIWWRWWAPFVTDFHYPNIFLIIFFRKTSRSSAESAGFRAWWGSMHNSRKHSAA